MEPSSSGLQTITEVLLPAAVALFGVRISLLLLKGAEPCGNPNISSMFLLEKIITACGCPLQPRLHEFLWGSGMCQSTGPGSCYSGQEIPAGEEFVLCKPWQLETLTSPVPLKTDDATLAAKSKEHSPVVEPRSLRVDLLTKRWCTDVVRNSGPRTSLGLDLGS